MSSAEEPSQKLSRLEICMFMQGNVFEFRDQTNQQDAVVNFILQKYCILIDEVNPKLLGGLKKSVKTFVSNLISKYKAQNKHIERLVQEESMENSRESKAIHGNPVGIPWSSHGIRFPPLAHSRPEGLPWA